MGELMRAYDWSSTPLGPITVWPQSLKTACGILLRSPVPIVMLWGEDGIMIYNDGYSVFAGQRHPQLLGSKVLEGWPEVADFNDNIMKTVRGRGETLQYREMELVLNRRGVMESGWMDLDYSPVPDESGQPAGVIAIVVEITDKVLAERRASKERKRQQAMLDQMPGFAGVMVGPDHVYEYANAAYRGLAGKREFIGRPVRDVFPEVEGQGFFELIDQVYETGERYIGRNLPVELEGRERHVDLLFEPIRDDKGEVNGIFVGGYDVTESTRIQEALVESEQSYRTLFEALDEGFMVIEQMPKDAGDLSNYRYITMNRAAGAMFGKPDLTGQTIRDNFPGEDEYWYQMYDRVVETGEAVRFEHGAVTQGMVLEMFLAPVGDPADKRIMVVMQNVTERRRAETDLRELNEQLESRVAAALAERRVLADIVDNTDAIVQVADLNYNWLAINKASSNEFFRVFGVHPRVGDNMLEVLADQPENQAAVKAVWAPAMAGHRYTDIGHFGDPDAPNAYEMRFDVLRDAEGKQIGAYQFVYDVTEKLRDQERLAEAEEALHQSQKMETVGQLTGGVAHDFNNLLTPIVGALDMLRNRVSADPRATRLADGALQAADRAQTLVQRLLAFSRRQHLAPRAVDVRGLIEGMTDLMARSLGPRIRMVLVVADNLPPAHVDPNQLELALLNLAVNARDAMSDDGGGEDGVLTIRAGLAEHERQPMICITVSDTGEGMDEATLKRAVEPFFTTKGVGRGTGLGLSSVQGLAVQSGGAFELSSRLGQGTTASLWLPVSEEAIEASPEKADQQPAAAPRTATVLLVDDEELVRMGTADMLIEAGYVVDEANSGVQALAMLRGGVKPDLIITDYAMPGMTGAELARQAKAIQPDLPVLMITGYAALTDREAGGLPRLAKPFRQADLVQAAEQLLEMAGA